MTRAQLRAVPKPLLGIAPVWDLMRLARLIPCIRTFPTSSEPSTNLSAKARDASRRIRHDSRPRPFPLARVASSLGSADLAFYLAGFCWRVLRDQEPSMNQPLILEIESANDSAPVQNLPAIADNSPASMMLTALSRGASLEQIEKMMDLQARWEANEARKSYNGAFASFKAEAVRIIKNRKVDAGPLSGKSYAELHSVVDAVTPALSKHGLSASWKLSKDDKDWIEVTCTLAHSQGHSESVSMGGPPDAGGAKNAIQARASTISYLERYTLKAICGVAEGGEDDDGAGGKQAPQCPPELLQLARDESMKGWKAFAAWIKTRTEAERKLLDPHSDSLKEAAKEADAKASK